MRMGVTRRLCGMLLVALLTWLVVVVEPFSTLPPMRVPLAVVVPPAGIHVRLPTSMRASENDGSENDKKKRKKLTASEQERREEEKRRISRTDDVVIGKTSAVKGAKDFALNPDATEQEWLRQASDVEQVVFRETDRGMELLKMLRLEEASEAFDRVFQLKPNAYLWQAGIAKFYQNQLEEAAEIFAKSAAIYESKFGDPASEERTWRHACELKLLNGMPRQQRKEAIASGLFAQKLTPLPQHDDLDDFLRSEMRKVSRVTREMFQASVEDDDVAVILNRAKLRSIGGTYDAKPVMDRKMWKLNSWFYLGLHYDVLGDEEESKKCMKTALRLCPNSGKASDIVHTLPLLHMSRRDWFDEEEFYPEEMLDVNERNMRAPSAGVDPTLAESIRSNLAEMTHTDLKDSLRVRGLGVKGSKEQLIDRLYDSLMNDTNLLP